MNAVKPKIMLVDDEVDTLEFLSYHLSSRGFIVKTATNGYQALTESKSFEPDIFLLDYMMPEMNGLELLSFYKKSNPKSKSLFVFLTAKNDDLTQIITFDMGASDYIMKPVKPDIIVSRLNALWRSFHGVNVHSDKVIQFDHLEINPEYFSVKLDGEEINLAKKEFDLLHIMTKKPGKVFNRFELMNIAWGEDSLVSERNIDVHIYRLREKLKNRYIKTIKGVGYKFDI